MYTKKYKMADKVIEISSLYEDVHNYCQGYEAFGQPDFSVEITQSDIDFEKKKSDSEYMPMRDCRFRISRRVFWRSRQFTARSQSR